MATYEFDVDDEHLEQIAQELFALLDQIIITGDASLANGMFDIMRKYGTVEFGCDVSSRSQ